MTNDVLSTAAARARLANSCLTRAGNEFDLGAGKKPQFVADGLGDRDLALAGDLGHKVRVTPVLLLPCCLPRGPRLRMPPIPLECLAQPPRKLYLWRPIGQLAQLARVDVLAVDLAVRGSRADVFG